MPEPIRYPSATLRALDLTQRIAGQQLTLTHRWMPGAVRDGGYGAVQITMRSAVGAILAGPRKLVISEDLFGRWRSLLADPASMLPGRFRCYRVSGSGRRGDPSLDELGTGGCVVEYVPPEEDV